ncbi:MAG: endonuclease III [Desulfobacterales bacterium]|nr:endonuclease III [Desulfobacterales bacterium]
MKIENRTVKIIEILNNTYPHVKTQLNHATPFQLLTATILSAQCTDRQVNNVTETLFKTLKKPEDFIKIELSVLEDLIRSTGYYKNKAKNLKNCAKVLMEKYGGVVPDNLNDLVGLPGVGRKTANVVLGSAFGIPGIVVDTHVSRISHRLNLTKNKEPVKIEFDLMKIIPKEEWDGFSLRLIYFGRQYCRARNPLCKDCPLYDLCEYPEKTA